MGVDSIFEMYTLLWGWHQYNAIWTILKDTGLAFVPFFGILLNAFLETSSSQNPGEAASTSLKIIEIDLFLALTVVVLAAHPLIPVQVEKMKYVKICEGGEVISDDLTLNQVWKKEKALVSLTPAFKTVKLPVWWYGVMAFSHGLVHAAQRTIPCVRDIHSDRIAIQTQVIDDPDLVRALEAFIEKCYFPTLSFYRQISKFNSSTYDRILSIYGKTDTEWPGSRVFIDLPNFYRSRVVEYPYLYVHQLRKGEGFIPYVEKINCEVIWEGGRVPVDTIRDDFGKEIRFTSHHPIDGLRTVLLFRYAPTPYRLQMGWSYHLHKKNIEDLLPIDQKRSKENFAKSDREIWYREKKHREESLELAERMRKAIGKNGCTDPSVDEVTMAIQDEFIRTLVGRGGMTPFHSLVEGEEGLVKELAELGKWVAPLGEQPKLQMFRDIIPPIGAFTLLCITVLLPLGLVFSGYSLEFLILGGLALFAVKFWFYLWHLAWWLEQNLWSALDVSPLYAEASSAENTVWLATTTLYLVLPLLFSVVVGWAGVHLAQGVTGAIDDMSSSLKEGAARGAIGLTGFVVKESVGLAKSKIYESKMEKLQERNKELKEELKLSKAALAEVDRDNQVLSDIAKKANFPKI